MYVKLSWRPQVDEKSHNCCTASNVDLPDYDVRTGLCLIYMSSFYFWIPPLARKMRKNNMLYYPNIRQGPGIPF
jgi:hypothetical protein